MEPITGVFIDALTGEEIIRELTQEEIDALPKTSDLPTDIQPIGA